jgi:hypothetical protein
VKYGQEQALVYNALLSYVGEPRVRHKSMIKRLNLAPFVRHEVARVFMVRHTNVCTVWGNGRPAMQ